MYGLSEQPGAQASGLHLLRPSPGGCTATQVWAGDARSCCIWDTSPSGSDGSHGSGGSVGLAVGTEPADVFTSLDGGRSWSPGTGSFAGAPSRAGWSFPAPPHEPHVLSLERTHSGQLAAGIEVGGVLVGACDPGAGSARFQERNAGLYPDIHSCRIDPHDSQHWLAVTGAQGALRHGPASWGCNRSAQLGARGVGMLMCMRFPRTPALGRGLYASSDGGGSWRPQGDWKGRYTIGLAFNPQAKVCGSLTYQRRPALRPHQASTALKPCCPCTLRCRARCW